MVLGVPFVPLGFEILFDVVATTTVGVALSAQERGTAFLVPVVEVM